MNKPNIIALVDLFRVIVMVAGCYFFIPFFATLAPAILALIINAGTLGFFILYVFRRIDEEKVIFQREAVTEPSWL